MSKEIVEHYVNTFLAPLIVLGRLQFHEGEQWTRQRQQAIGEHTWKHRRTDPEFREGRQLTPTPPPVPIPDPIIEDKIIPGPPKPPGPINGGDRRGQQKGAIQYL